MQEPIGLSGVQTVPNSLQSVGFFAPRRIEGHSQLLASRAGFVDDGEAPLGVEGGVSFLDAECAVGNEPKSAPLEGRPKLEDIGDELLAPSDCLPASPRGHTGSRPRAGPR